MKQFLFSLLIYSCVSLSFMVAQSGSDTLRLKEQLAAAKTLMDSSQLEQALELMESLTPLQEGASDSLQRELAYYWFDLGVAYYGIGDIEKITLSWERATNLMEPTRYAKNEFMAKLLNNLGVVKQYAGDLKGALSCFKRSLQNRLDRGQANTFEVAQNYNNIGVIHSDLGDNQAAIANYLLSVEIKRKVDPNDSLSLISTYQNIAVVYTELRNTQLSIQLLKRIEGIIAAYPEQDLRREQAKLYNNWGVAYNNRRDFYQAILMHEKSAAIRKDFFGEQSPELAQAYGNLGGVYQEMQDYNNARINYEMARRALAGSDDSVEASAALARLGGLEALRGNFEQANEYANQALKTLLPLLTDGHYLIGETYDLKASIAQYVGKYDSSIYYFEKGLAAKGNQLGNVLTYEQIRSKLNIASTYYLMGDEDRALAAYDATLEYLEVASQQNRELKFLLFENLLFRSRLLLYSSDSAKRKAALPNFERAYTFSETYRDELEDQYAKQEFLELIKELTEGYLLALLREDPQDKNGKAFAVAERSKAFLLTENLQQVQALRLGKVDESVINREAALKAGIRYQEKLLFETKNQSDPDQDIVAAISDSLLILNEAFTQFKRSVRRDYPDYNTLRYGYEQRPLAYYQREVLGPDEAMISYFVGDSNLFIFTLQRNNYTVTQTKGVTALEEWVSKLTQEGLYGYYNAPKRKQNTELLGRTLSNYATAGSQLYDILLAPVKSQLTPQQALIIIPDGILGYVPFEALLTEMPANLEKPSRYRYVLEEHPISYTYSVAALVNLRNKQHQQEPDRSVLAMAPFFLGNADTLTVQVDTTDFIFTLSTKGGKINLDALPSSGPEVKGIATTFKGDAYYGAEAQRALFLSSADRYRILHLSTHGWANDEAGEYSFLAFADVKRLYAKDVYGLQLNADMVVLSACEAGVGQLQRGEGIISLARAFAYAGAKSIFTTLWQVEVNATTDLSISFYQYLKAGKDKRMALHLAKLDYLKRYRKHQQKGHPFFWAGLIGLGDMQPLGEESE